MDKKILQPLLKAIKSEKEAAGYPYRNGSMRYSEELKELTINLLSISKMSILRFSELTELGLTTIRRWRMEYNNKTKNTCIQELKIIHDKNIMAPSNLCNYDSDSDINIDTEDVNQNFVLTLPTGGIIRIDKQAMRYVFKLLSKQESLI